MASPEGEAVTVRSLMREELAKADRLRFAIGSIHQNRPCGATFPRGGRL